jgi:hypothetical protein
MSFDPYDHLLKIWESIGITAPKVSSFGSVGVHSLMFSYILGSMKCDVLPSSLINSSVSLK